MWQACPLRFHSVKTEKTDKIRPSLTSFPSPPGERGPSHGKPHQDHGTRQPTSPLPVRAVAKMLSVK